MVTETVSTQKIDTTVREKPTYIEEIWKNRKGKWNRSRVLLTIISLLAIGLSIFHVYTAGFGTLSSWQQRSIHVLWAMLLIFLLFPFKKGKKFGVIDIVIIIVTMATAGYMLFGAKRYYEEQGVLE
ncbi:hypothetical protein [Oceanobacillus sp. J11TS1]|uniref:hypothetical protein n=1 Tax=Oceanobacillus sp. J11TS1 TaxID=2807191 RepID=UPI001B1F15E6|nr:hypothetical protein [Oceanobacillus sp. J11TS1]GIO22548.1 hypothetical protein J11TS1_11290 [Oceanobacillus sp. J11TS1]